MGIVQEAAIRSDSVPSGTSGSRRPARFVTFYSYKGGVGRTMALLNVALRFAGQGQRVLMIDFDLEAPGLTTLCSEFGKGEQSHVAAEDNYTGRKQRDLNDEGIEKPAPGVLDLLYDAVTDADNSDLFLVPERSGSARLEDPLSPLPKEAAEKVRRWLGGYVSRVEIPPTYGASADGVLHLMAAGRDDGRFGERRSILDIGRLYVEGFGQPLIQRFKDAVSYCGRYDLVLVDSRTGFSEEGGICTRDLADYLIVLTGLNCQNTAGTISFLQRLRQSNAVSARPERLQIVFSHVPLDNSTTYQRCNDVISMIEQEAGYAMERAEERSAVRAPTLRGAHGRMPCLMLPYSAEMSLREEPFSAPPEQLQTPLYIAYANLFERARDMIGWGTSDLLTRIGSFISQGKIEGVLQILHELRRVSPEVTAGALSMMTERWLTSIACTPAALEQNPNRQEQVNDLFQMLTEIVGRDGDVYRRWGRILMQAGNLEGAEAKFKEALDVAEARLDARNEAMTLLRLAALDALRGKLDDALNKVDRADSTVLRAHLDEGDILRVQCLSSHYRGSIYYLRSRGKEAYLKEDKGVIPGSEYARDMALHAYKEAQELACRTDHQVMLSTTSSQIGKLRVLEALRTADEEAIDHGLEEILNAIRTLEAQDPALTAEAQLDYAEALLEADRARSAETYLDKWWEPLKRSATMLIFMTAHVVRARALRQLADDCGREGDTESARNFRKRSSEFAREATRFFKERGVKEGYTAREAAALADASEP